MILTHAVFFDADHNLLPSKGFSIDDLNDL